MVHKKTATAVALTEVRNEDKAQLENFVTLFDTNYNHNEDLKKTWGGGILGSKSQHRVEAQAQAIKEEQIKKANLWLIWFLWILYAFLLCFPFQDCCNQYHLLFKQNNIISKYPHKYPNYNNKIKNFIFCILLNCNILPDFCLRKKNSFLSSSPVSYVLFFQMKINRWNN